MFDMYSNRHNDQGWAEYVVRRTSTQGRSVEVEDGLSWERSQLVSSWRPKELLWTKSCHPIKSLSPTSLGIWRLSWIGSVNSGESQRVKLWSSCSCNEKMFLHMRCMVDRIKWIGIRLRIIKMTTWSTPRNASTHAETPGHAKSYLVGRISHLADGQQVFLDSSHTHESW